MRNQDYIALEIGQRLREVRKKLNIQQKDIAEAMGIDVSLFCEIEAGRVNPAPDFFVNLATLYKINLNYIFMNAKDLFVDESYKIKEADVDLDASIDSIEKVNWLMENSVHVKYSILNNVNRILWENKSFIIDEIKRKKRKKVELTKKNEVSIEG